MLRKILLALLLCTVLAGCKSSPVLGTWVSNNGQAAKGAGVITFSNDGTFEAQVAGSSSSLFSGTWELRGNQIDLVVDRSGGTQLPFDSDQPLGATLSSDGKTMNIGAAVFTKK